MLLCDALCDIILLNMMLLDIDRHNIHEIMCDVVYVCVCIETVI